MSGDRSCFGFALLILFITATGATQNQAATQAGPDLKAIFEPKVRVEWEALKKKDKKAYGDLLADDFQGVEVDGKGERTRAQAMNEVAEENVSNYTLWGFKFIPLGPEAAFVIYESTITFPPKSVLRYSRVYISELWVKRGGEWKELHYQETHVK
ncbi:MAG TPA: nuclear transport factor 2 family protein [Terriglobales bacterium]|nr:nuclear transport factor 2 family protein [Terriglobales bacterium]